MNARTRWALALALLLGPACRLESHPPAGIPAEEAAIRSAVAAWLARAEPWARILRSDVRQERDLATAWVVTSPASNQGDGERTELFVLRREPVGWIVAFHDGPNRVREVPVTEVR
jgi:hypothetical protein